MAKGKVKFTFADGHEETYEGGDAYYAPPGHTPHLYAGSEVVEFHPTSELAKTWRSSKRILRRWARSGPFVHSDPGLS